MRISRRIALVLAMCSLAAVLILWPGLRLQSLNRNELLAWTRTNAAMPASPTCADWNDVCPPIPKSVPSVSTSLCAARKDPGAFACKRITFPATVSSDCMEHSGLVESSCGVGIDPFGGSSSPALDRLYLTVCERSVNGKIDFNRRISGTFTGVFLWWHATPSDRFAVRLEDVTAVRIDPAQTP